MGKKKGGKGGGGGGGGKEEVKRKGEGENKKKEGENGLTVILKVDMHCEGCADKLVRLAKSIDGVEKAKAEWGASKLTVRGEMDPSELREELQAKAKKEVELVSPQLPKKDKDKDSKSSASSGNNNKAKDKKAEDKKPKEPPVTTAVLRLELHCAGCIERIYKAASKTKGVQSIAFDKEKDLVTVMGAMDAKALVESLRAKMKKPVEVVQLKDKDGGGGGGGKKNKKGGGNGGKEEGDDGGNGWAEIYGGPEENFGGRRMEYNGVPPGFGYNGIPPGFGYNGYNGMPPGLGYNGVPPGYNGIPPGYGYNYGLMYGNHLHAPQMFSDENPNACHIM